MQAGRFCAENRLVIQHCRVEASL